MMNCDAYRMMTQQLLDGWEPGEEERAAMEAHEKACAACRAWGEQMRALHACCARLDEELKAPEAFQNGWRQAVKREAERKHRRFSPRALAGVAAGVLVVALGGASVMNGPSAAKDSAQPQLAANRSAAYGRAAAPEVLMMEAETDDAAMDGGMQTESKRIRTASIELRTGEFDRTLALLQALPAEYGGYVSDENRYGVAGEEARSAYLNVRVEAEQLEAFLARAETLGQVRSRSVASQDVTQAYTDTSGRLETARARRTRLNELIAQAQDLSELIELEAALSDVQATIEEYERTLQRWDAQVQLATVSVTLVETRSEDAAREGELGLIARVGNALAESARGLGAFLQGALVFAIAALPWAALAAAVGLLVYRIFKRRRTPRK